MNQTTELTAVMSGEPAAPVRDMEVITAEILEAKRIGGQAIITIGQRLTEAKAQLPHGEWLGWLAERVEYSERTAQAFMRIARECSNPQLVADLGVRKALALLALPPSEREGFAAEVHPVDGQDKTISEMTARELEQAIRERDEARRLAEQAQAESRAAAESITSMEQYLRLTTAMLDRARADKKLADGVVSALEQQLAELKAAPVEVAVMAVDQEALDRARAEGEAARAEELAQLQGKLDRAKAAKKKADEKREQAEAAVEVVRWIRLPEIRDPLSPKTA